MLERKSGHVINVAGGRRTSLNTLWREVCDLVGVEIEARHADPRPGDVRDSLAGLERAGELLEYSPEIDLRTGLARTIESLRKTLETPRG